MTDKEHLEVQRNLFNIYSGILFNNQAFIQGGTAEIVYDFDCPEYKALLENTPSTRLPGRVRPSSGACG